MICRKLLEKKNGVIILDPMRSVDWGVDTHKEQSSFLEEVKSRQDCFIFVDEAGAAIGRYNVEMEWCATTGRHFGHKSCFICQYISQLSPVVRSNCAEVYLFATDFNTRKKLAEEFDQPTIENIRLNRGEFVMLNRFGPPDFRRIDVDKGTVVRLQSPSK